MKPGILLSVVLASALSVTGAAAQQAALPGVPVRLGADIATAKAALGTTLDPEPMAPSRGMPERLDPNRGKTFLHLRTKGIWVFFGPAGQAETIRLDAPFAGAIKGVKLGDTVKKMKSVLGEPTKSWDVVTRTAYRYMLDPTASMVFHADDEVEIIFLNRQSR